MLPDVLKQTGVTTQEASPDILMSVNIYSPDGRYDQLYLSNYALMHVRTSCSRLPGVSDVIMFGQRDYSMRIWLDPDKLAVAEPDGRRRGQRHPRAEPAGGRRPDRPAADPARASRPRSRSTTLGRLVEPEQFAEHHPQDDAATAGSSGSGTSPASSWAPRTRTSAARSTASPSAGLVIFQLPDANALDTADLVQAKMDELKKDFPEGLDYEIRYDTTPYIRESIDEVFKTLRDAVILVALVVLLFLQNWRSAVIPLIAVPVAIVGTFAVMAAMGFSLNNLTLFGLVLAIGIVVDDAIVVVEAVEHHIEHGLAPREATIKAMSEVSGPVIAVGLVLSARVRPLRVHQRASPASSSASSP